jgi:hypothetical protein
MHTMPLRIFLILFILALIYPSTLPAATEQRTALVIGNSSYSSGPLKNPANDATDMAAALKRAGFLVALKKDANLREMIEAIEEFEVDPLVCPRCQGTMRIISFIEDRQVIRAILEHLGIWLVRARPPPKIHCLPVCIHNAGRSAAPSIPDDVSQITPHADHFYGDPQYSWDDYIQA